MKILVEVPDRGVWSNIFGSMYSQYPWWQDEYHLEGDWQHQGKVRLSIDDPAFPEGSGKVLTGIIDMSILEAAINKCLERELIPNAPEEWASADYADAILQMAVLGEVPYG